ncbi:hypothetical protein ACQUSR_18025 [Streptomyces sp. P1-3]
MGDFESDMAIAPQPEGTELTPEEAALAADLEQGSAAATDEAV